jgi:hypothetical protein
MKKNWEIIREILLRLEEASTPNTVLNAKDIPHYSDQEVAYNIRLLKEAGFIVGNISESSTGNGHIDVALARRLTDAGHQLIETMRNDTIWSKVKDKFAKKGIEMSFDLVLAYGKKAMEASLFS